MALTESEITRLLDRWNEGNREALDELMPIVIGDLRRIAAHRLAGEAPDHTLQATALVNEVYLRLVGRRTVSWRNRTQFFAVVAGLMRRILVDHSRKRQAAKRGSGMIRITLDGSETLPAPRKDPDVLSLDDALRSLEAVDGRQSRIVEMRYFGGLSVEEVSAALEVSPTTVKREWRTAKMWLYKELSRA